MSNIPQAKQCLKNALRFPENAKYWIEAALPLLDREPAVRVARRKPIEITDDMKRRMEKLARNPDRTMQEIAEITGVRSSGRVSEVLNGLR